jgi:antitoxin component of MazEF toxin-antitoxin module
MKKNFDDNTETISIDPITGNYYVVIPEWIANELSWYEDTEIKFAVEGNEVILTEKMDS